MGGFLGDWNNVTKLDPRSLEVTNNHLKGHESPSEKGHKELPGTHFFPSFRVFSFLIGIKWEIFSSPEFLLNLLQLENST